MIRWLIGFGLLMIVVGVSMAADGTWTMTDEEYRARLDARKKAKAAKAANGAKRSG